MITIRPTFLKLLGGSTQEHIIKTYITPIKFFGGVKNSPCIWDVSVQMYKSRYTIMEKNILLHAPYEGKYLL